jgi:hypothetical protein
MRERLKTLLKGQGTPVLQTCDAGGETIISAANIWTSAHGRRIELRGVGLGRGDVLASSLGGFQAIVDFVACAIGGFIYLPLSPEALAMLRAEPFAPAGGAGIMLVAEGLEPRHHEGVLPARLHGAVRTPGALLVLLGESEPRTFTALAIEARLAALQAKLRTRDGATRLSYDACHNDMALIDDLLLGLFNRQTIHLRRGAGLNAAQMLAEAGRLEAEELAVSGENLDLPGLRAMA